MNIEIDTGPMFYKDANSYHIQSCGETDIDRIMRFFGEYWDKNHLMATSRSFVTERFCRAAGGYSLLAAYGKAAEQPVLGILGYLPNSRFDPALTGADDFCWLTNWLAAPDAPNGLGLALYAALIEFERPVNVGTVGNNALAEGIYRAMRFQTGCLRHYILINPRRRRLLLSGFGERLSKSSSDEARGGKLIPITSVREAESVFQAGNASFPPKTAVYIDSKYLRSPYHNYLAYRVLNKSGEGLLIGRLLAYDGAKMLRVVDYVGAPEALANMNAPLCGIMEILGVEYLEFYCAGFPDGILESAGFIAVREGQVAPGYFEPFQPENVIIRYACHTGDGRAPIIFRGDGDRDHPRAI